MKYLLPVILCLSVITGPAFAQNCEIRNLVFEGAGIRGIAYAGVIAELEKQQMLGQIQKVGGTSAGAITALMLSLNYSSADIARIVSSTEFRKFNDGQFIFVGGIARMKKGYGWYRGDKFTSWLADIIARKTGDSEITFRQLHTKGFKDLYVTGTCLNRQQLIVFSRENYPNMKIKDAVRISMSIPLYFKAVLIDSAGTVHKKPAENLKTDIMVDGGITGNFPIFMFDAVMTGADGKVIRKANPATLGVRIDSDDQIRSDQVSRQLSPIPIRNFNDYMSALYVYIIENLNRNELTDADWRRTISVSSVGINPRIRKMSEAQKNLLTDSGKRFTAAFLKDNCLPLNKD